MAQETAQDAPASATDTVGEGAGSVAFQTELSMTVTDLAKEKLNGFLGDDKTLDDIGVRITVEPGGCSGASYGMGFASAPEENELELRANGVRLFLDPQFAPVLNGLKVDYVDELMGGGFKIFNPNATSTCGCGKSFSA